MFPCCAGMGEGFSGLEDTVVLSATVRRESMTMEVSALFPVMPSAAEVSALEWRLRQEYGLRGVTLTASWPKAEPSAPEEKKAVGKVLYGKRIKSRPIPISKADPEMKSVVV